MNGKEQSIQKYLWDLEAQDDLQCPGLLAAQLAQEDPGDQGFLWDLQRKWWENVGVTDITERFTHNKQLNTASPKGTESTGHIIRWGIGSLTMFWVTQHRWNQFVHMGKSLMVFPVIPPFGGRRGMALSGFTLPIIKEGNLDPVFFTSPRNLLEVQSH